MTYTQKIVNGRTGEEQIIPLTVEEIAEIEARQALVPALQMEQLRAKRDQLLTETDYLGLPDLGGFSAEMTAYRQALRDLPANTTDPANPVWPTKPEVN
jgi:hypothetical protein